MSNFLTHVVPTETDRGRSVNSDVDFGGKEEGTKTGLH